MYSNEVFQELTSANISLSVGTGMDTLAVMFLFLMAWKRYSPANHYFVSKIKFHILNENN